MRVIKDVRPVRGGHWIYSIPACSKAILFYIILLSYSYILFYSHKFESSDVKILMYYSYFPQIPCIILTEKSFCHLSVRRVWVILCTVICASMSFYIDIWKHHLLRQLAISAAIHQNDQQVNVCRILLTVLLSHESISLNVLQVQNRPVTYYHTSVLIYHCLSVHVVKT